MFKTGLVSVTFRNLTPAVITDLTAEAMLCGIEWGADVHVRPEDLENAAAVGAYTRERGLSNISYGAYYYAGYSEENFGDLIAGAKALGAPNIRVWAGKKGSAEEDGRRMVVDSLRRITEEAARENITVSLEFHRRTLTDTPDSARRLMEEVANENLHLYWQPNQDMDAAYNVQSIRTVLPYISNVHVFAWEGSQKFPLSHGEKDWRQYLDALADSGREHALLLEFVCDGTEDQFRRDAETLRNWL